METTKTIKDSGTRREFDTGAVRDIQVGKGRCDLIPLEAASTIISNNTYSEILKNIDKYIWTGNIELISDSIMLFTKVKHVSSAGLLLEVSHHYEDGCIKYGERNWEKGIPAHSYVDSGVRHLLKHLDGWEDEPHDRAFVWNMLGLIWTHNNKYELVDLPFKVE